MLREARRESENLLRRLREASYEELPEIVNQARERISHDLKELEAIPTVAKHESQLQPENLRPGMNVKAISLDQVGTVLEVGNESVMVQLGILKVSLPISDLELSNVAPQKLKPTRGGGGDAGMATAARISAEISLRGLNVDEALYQLEKYLDQAIMAGLNRFRVIHGKGTGVLRQAVWEYLKANPVVKEFQYAEQNEGGLGATTVELKKS